METKTVGLPQDVRVIESVQVIGNVHVIGVQIGFGKMVVPLVELALAAIPAAIILAFIGALLFAILTGIVGHH